MSLEIIVLAAGSGRRMHSKLPKVLHQLAGKPLLAHVIDAIIPLNAQAIHLVGGATIAQLQASLPDPALRWVHQAQPLGTGHAVAQAIPAIASDSTVLVVYGDVPLIATSTLAKLAAIANTSTVALLTAQLGDPTGYGRIIRNDAGAVEAIIEEKDASATQRAICEVNTGIIAAPAARLQHWLSQLSADNAANEHYLTDIVAIAASEGLSVLTHQADNHWQVQGVNTRQQLSELERYYQRQQAERLLGQGVTLADPDRIDVRGELAVGCDSFIDSNCVFHGEVVIGDDVTIEPGCVITDTTVGDGSHIKAHSVLTGTTLGKHCTIGPFAHLRPGTQLADQVKIGNFVETKNTVLAAGCKASHLSYLGDIESGAQSNFGAGTINCNYDGVAKHKTTVGERAFIGSNVSLVAPVTLGNDATVGAGSTITHDVDDDQLAVTRAEQKNFNGWQRPTKKR